MLPSRQVPAKQLIPDWLDSWEFSRFVTLATNDVSITGSSLPTSKLPYGILRDRLREWDGRMNRQIVGKHWRKREADRMWAFYFLEKPDVNPHWHGLVRFFPIEGKSEAYQQAVFDENAGPTWKELVPSGTVDVQPVPMQLADSHIALRGHEGGAAFGGLELEPALEHDDGSGLAVVAGPSAEAGADPCRIGERAPGVGVALSFGLAFEALAQGFDEGQVVRAEGVGDGPEAALTGAAVAGVDELLDGDGGDERRHGELAPGGVLADAHRLDVEALGLEGAEQLLDRPAAAVQVGDREGLGRIRDRERGEEPPVHALARRRIDLAHVDEVEDDALRQAGPHPNRWPRELDGHETDRHERLAGGAAGLCRQPQPRPSVPRRERPPARTAARRRRGCGPGRPAPKAPSWPAGARRPRRCRSRDRRSP